MATLTAYNVTDNFRQQSFPCAVANLSEVVNASGSGDIIVSHGTSYHDFTMLNYQGSATQFLSDLKAVIPTLDSYASELDIDRAFVLTYSPNSVQYPEFAFDYNDYGGYAGVGSAIMFSSSQSAGGTGINPLIYTNAPTYKIIPIGLYDHDDVYAGLLNVYQDPFTLTISARFIVTNCTDYSISILNPGNPGYKPTNDYINNLRGGGTVSGGVPDYYTDEVEQPGEPDESKASAIGSGFITAYDITEAQLMNFGKCLWSSTLLTALANLFIDPIDAVISLSVFPYVPHIGSNTPIKIFNHVCTQADLGVDASAAPLTSEFRTVDFGTITINESWNSFLDYSNTSVSLYLPFIGVVDLPINEVMGSTINVQYTIDFFTGMCVANVLCQKTIALSEDRVVPQYSQHSYQGNCAVQIPVNSRDYGSMIGSLMNACATGLTSGIEAGVMAAGSDAIGGRWKPATATKGSIVANAGFCSVLYPYITIERPIPVIPESFQEVHGFISYVKSTLGSCEGLCVCDDIDVEGIVGATAEELNRIKNLCREGIYI